MAVKKRLGRGLSDMEGLNALFGSTPPSPHPASPSGDHHEESSERSDEELKEIAVTDLQPGQHQPRRAFDEAALNGLASSIKHDGLLQPILVQPISPTPPRGQPHYEIIAGERRWRAAMIVAHKTVHCIIRHHTSAAVAELALIENIQREDLSPIDRAHAYQKLILRHGYTQDDLASRLSISRAAVANTIRLLRLPLSLQNLIGDSTLSPGMARQILRIDNIPDQEALTSFFLENHISVRQAEVLVGLCLERSVEAVIQDGPPSQQPQSLPISVEDAPSSPAPPYRAAEKQTPAKAHSGAAKDDFAAYAHILMKRLGAITASESAAGDGVALSGAKVSSSAMKRLVLSNMARLEVALQKMLGLHVKIKHTSAHGSGAVQIDYANSEEFITLVNCLVARDHLINSHSISDR